MFLSKWVNYRSATARCPALQGLLPAALYEPMHQKPSRDSHTRNNVVKNIYKYLIYYLESWVNRGAYTPFFPRLLHQMVALFCLLVRCKYHLSIASPFTPHSWQVFSNTVYTACQLRLPPPARYTHNTGTTSGKRVTEKPRERVHQWQNNTATICIRYIWCKQTQAGFVRSPRDYRLVRLLPEYNERHFYHADDKK